MDKMNTEMNTGNFALFSGNTYYPRGGFGDLTARFDTLEEAIEFAKKEAKDWNYIVDVSLFKEICDCCWITKRKSKKGENGKRIYWDEEKWDVVYYS